VDDLDEPPTPVRSTHANICGFQLVPTPGTVVATLDNLEAELACGAAYPY
jgi:hypothetical protein